MAEELSPYDKVNNHLNTHARNWEVQSARVVGPEYPNNDKHGIAEDEVNIKFFRLNGVFFHRKHKYIQHGSDQTPTEPDESGNRRRVEARSPFYRPRTPSYVHRPPRSLSTVQLQRWNGGGMGYPVRREWIDDLAPGSSNLVITPEKLSALYSRYRLNPEIYPFVEILNSRARDAHDRLADFFTDLDCQYHLVQPNPYSRPRVPALTPLGFVQYFTTCILAHPDEEFRRLDKIVADVQLVVVPDSSSCNPTPAPAPTAGGDATGEHPPERLPRQLFRSQFPVRHDPKSKKILAAALDDLIYDLRILEPSSPRSPLALMPPPPPLPPAPSSTSAQDRRNSIVPIIRRYVVPGRRDEFPEAGRYDDGNGNNDNNNNNNNRSSREPYRDRERNYFTSSKDLSAYQIVSSPSKKSNSSSSSTNNAVANYSPTRTSRPARSPPPRPTPHYRASAPSVSSSFRPPGYLPAPAPVPAPAPPPSIPSSREYATGRRQSSSGRIETSTETMPSSFSPSSSSRDGFESMALVPISAEAKQHQHQHRYRRHSVVEQGGGGGGEEGEEDDDKGPTWAEVLKSSTSTSPPSHHHHHNHHHHHHHHNTHHHHNHHHRRQEESSNSSSSKAGTGKSHPSRHHSSH
ncbi:hypothetical protein Daesc_003450 [Daldinia eschscholtzii]|uniref:DUF7514 domain-containing protein n=1 Tax=Daldinia eschscholtzii TaxID=292717 RepID=A0AAX6MTF6_9PEZI